MAERPAEPFTTPFVSHTRRSSSQNYQIMCSTSENFSKGPEILVTHNAIHKRAREIQDEGKFPTKHLATKADRLLGQYTDCPAGVCASETFKTTLNKLVVCSAQDWRSQSAGGKSALRTASLLNTKITKLNILLLEEFGLGKVFRLKLHN